MKRKVTERRRHRKLTHQPLHISMRPGVEASCRAEARLYRSHALPMQQLRARRFNRVANLQGARVSASQKQACVCRGSRTVWPRLSSSRTPVICHGGLSQCGRAMTAAARVCDIPPSGPPQQPLL